MGQIIKLLIYVTLSFCQSVCRHSYGRNFDSILMKQWIYAAIYVEYRRDVPWQKLSKSVIVLQNYSKMRLVFVRHGVFQKVRTGSLTACKLSTTFMYS